MTCNECDSSFSNVKGLHLHIGKKHDSLESYYWKHNPRLDLFSGEPIKFKNLEEYNSIDFNSKENFCKWCFSVEKEVAQEYVVNLFNERSKKKNSKFVPSQVELKSLFLPSWFGLLSIFGSTEKVLESLGSFLLFKFNYNHVPFLSEDEPEILIDTREQIPLNFKNSKTQKLSCGDYTTNGPLFSDVFIERKSLNDLFSTLSSNKDRFIREIRRAMDLGYYLVVLIDEDFKKTLDSGPGNNFSKIANGKYIMFSIREIMSEHNNIQFVFSGSRKKSEDLVCKIFKLKSQVRFLDLEYLKDFNLI